MSENLPWDTIKNEVAKAIGIRYPIADRVRFINVREICNTIDANPERYPVTAPVSLSRRKAWCTIAIRDHLGWTQYAKGRRRTGNGGTFLRPGCEGE